MSDTTTERTESSVDADPRPIWLPTALRVLVVVPIVVAVVRALVTGWFPVGDSALLALRAFDVGTADHPLLGSWTSASLTLGTDVNNPGALYADLLAPFMWTIGRWFGIGPATALGVGTVNATFALLTIWVGRQLGGWRSERFAILLVVALTWSMGSELLIDIWQPHALLLPFACLLYLTTSLIAGRWRLVPLWLGVVSLVVQTHLGYVYVVGVLVLLVGGHGLAALRSAGTSPGRLARHRLTWWSVGVLAVAWFQPVVEQLFGAGRGNLLRLATNAGGGEVTIGAATAVKLVAQVVVLPPWWTRAGFEDAVMSTPLTEAEDGVRLVVPGLPSGFVALLAVIGVVAGLAALWWRSRRLTEPAAALLVAWVGVVTAVVTLTVQTVSVVGLSSHHVRWLWVLSLFVFVTMLWAVVEHGWLQGATGAVTPVLAASVVVLTISNLTVTAHDVGPTADRAAADTLSGTFDDLAGFDPDGPVRYATDDLRPFEPWSSAVQMRLRELGIEFRVDDEVSARQLGNRRRADGSEATVLRQVERGAALRYDGPGCVVSASSPLSEDAETRVDAVIDAAAVDLATGAAVIRLDGLEPGLAARLAAASTGDDAEAFVLVADGLLPFLASEGRITRSTPAVDRAVAEAESIDRRVRGTLVLVVEPPIGCR